MKNFSMQDWREIVRQRLGSSDLKIANQDEVDSELACHLEETYDDARSRGLTDTAAIELTMQEVEDWRVLAKDICRAQSKEDTMNSRTKKLWLPALVSITFTAVLLVVFDKVHASSLTVGLGHLAMMLQLAFFAAMPIFGQTKSEEALMNSRTRSIWMPGFVTLTAASLFLFAEEFLLAHDPSFTAWRVPPKQLVSGLALLPYFAWLLAQVLCGALGAFLSRRGGGTRMARIVAGAFPAITMFLLFALVIPVSVFVERNAFVLQHPSVLLFGMLVWVGGPAVALLLGAAPFLKNPHLQEA